MNLGPDLAIPLVTLTCVGVAAGAYPGLKMNRASIALVGAVGLVALRVMTPSAALGAIDPNTLLLLFAMMVISAHLRLAGFFNWVGQLIAVHVRSPRLFLAAVIAASGVLAAIFLNDTVALALTPLVLEVTRGRGRNPLPYLIGLAAAVNIGSVATLTGNPQNILIGQSSHIPFVAFLDALAPVAVIGLCLAWLILVRLYRSEFAQAWPAEPVQLNVMVDAGLLRKCLLLIALLLVAFVAGAPIALAAIIVAAALLVSRRTDPEAVFARVDWPLLVFFAGLFVVTGAVQITHLTDGLLAWVGPLSQLGVAPLAIVVAVLSNLVSNVPAVLLFRAAVPQMPDAGRAWLTLAMASTLAGNLTLLGSVANLIVAEIARAQGVELSFREYLKAGALITLATLAAGILWLSLVG